MLQQKIEAKTEAATRSYEVANIAHQAWHVRVRAGLPFELRCYGEGHWCGANGEPHYHATEAAANAAGERWLVEGKRS